MVALAGCDQRARQEASRSARSALKDFVDSPEPTVNELAAELSEAKADNFARYVEMKAQNASQARELERSVAAHVALVRAEREEQLYVSQLELMLADTRDSFVVGGRRNTTRAEVELEIASRRPELTRLRARVSASELSIAARRTAITKTEATLQAVRVQLDAYDARVQATVADTNRALARKQLVALTGAARDLLASTDDKTAEAFRKLEEIGARADAIADAADDTPTSGRLFPNVIDAAHVEHGR